MRFARFLLAGGNGQIRAGLKPVTSAFVTVVPRFLLAGGNGRGPRAHAPQLAERVETAAPAEPEEPPAELAAMAEFGELDTRVHAWQRVLAREDYVALLDTQSAYRVLDAGIREALFDAVRAALGEQVVMAVSTLLHLARRQA